MVFIDNTYMMYANRVTQIQTRLKCILTLFGIFRKVNICVLSVDLLLAFDCFGHIHTFKPNRTILHPDRGKEVAQKKRVVGQDVDSRSSCVIAAEISHAVPTL